MAQAGCGRGLTGGADPGAVAVRPAGAAVAGEGLRHARGQRGAVADAGEGSCAGMGSRAGRSQSQARAGRGLGAW